MREMINKYAYYIIGAVVVVAILLFFLRGGEKPNNVTAASKTFYVDEETGKESVRAGIEFPPLVGASGKRTLVQACKFSADGGETKTIAYLLKYTDEAQEELASKPNLDDSRKSDLARDCLLVRRPGDGQKWVLRSSTEGQNIVNNPIPGAERIQPVWAK